jgi:hypothetical protein
MIYTIQIFCLGMCAGFVLVWCYRVGERNKRWQVRSRIKDKRGLELYLKRGREEIVLFWVQFERKSSANPDNTFSDQLTQARYRAYERAAELNAHDQIVREHS